MSVVTHVGRVMVPVSDQDTAIAFYSEKLGFELSADVPFGEGERWVEVSPPGGGAAIALVPSRGEYVTGRMTGIALTQRTPARRTPSCRATASTSTPRSWAATARCR